MRLVYFFTSFDSGFYAFLEDLFFYCIYLITNLTEVVFFSFVLIFRTLYHK